MAGSPIGRWLQGQRIIAIDKQGRDGCRLKVSPMGWSATHGRDGGVYGRADEDRAHGDQSWRERRRGKGAEPPLALIYSSPRSANDVVASPATTKWSSTRTSTSASACLSA